MLELLRSSVDEHGQTVVMVTHDPVAAAYTDRVIFLADGRIVEAAAQPHARRGPRGDGPDGRPAQRTGRHDPRALKSLLARKVRLLLSTFSIVLGVAFVTGLLIFSDTLSRNCTALFASTVGDAVLRPVGSQIAAGAPSALTVPGQPARPPRGRRRRARVDGNVNASGVYVVGADNKVVGGLGPPAFGGNWKTRRRRAGGGWISSTVTRPRASRR